MPLIVFCFPCKHCTLTQPNLCGKIPHFIFVKTRKDTALRFCKTHVLFQCTNISLVCRNHVLIMYWNNIQENLLFCFYIYFFSSWNDIWIQFYRNLSLCFTMKRYLYTGNDWINQIKIHHEYPMNLSVTKDLIHRIFIRCFRRQKSNYATWFTVDCE